MLEQLAQAILDIKDKLGICAQCNNISDGELCLYCRDPHRERSQICVVEEPHNILSIETTHSFRGLYHVLHGRFPRCAASVRSNCESKGWLTGCIDDEVQEIISQRIRRWKAKRRPSILSRLLKPLGPRVTRIAMGIPVGSDLEFADEVTMSRSLENRREM